MGRELPPPQGLLALRRPVRGEGSCVVTLHSGEGRDHRALLRVRGATGAERGPRWFGSGVGTREAGPGTRGTGVPHPVGRDFLSAIRVSIWYTAAYWILDRSHAPQYRAVQIGCNALVLRHQPSILVLTTTACCWAGKKGGLGEWAGDDLLQSSSCPQPSRMNLCLQE